MATRLPDELANKVRQMADDLDLTYSDTLVILVEVAFRDGTLPTRAQLELKPTG